MFVQRIHDRGLTHRWRTRRVGNTRLDSRQTNMSVTASFALPPSTLSLGLGNLATIVRHRAKPHRFRGRVQLPQDGRRET